MQRERDVLMHNIFPRLQAEAAKKLISIEAVDLRWGITEEEAHSGRVLELCLKEIDRSLPFFIGLVGDRYGWCPHEKEVSLNPALTPEEIFKDLRDRLSITEIEMRYGALRNPLMVHGLFYLKSSQGEERAEKLKQTIRETNGITWRNYDNCSTNDNGLNKLVYYDLKKLVDTLYSDHTEDLNNLQISFAYYLAERIENFSQPEPGGAYDRLLALPENTGNIIAIVGEDGKTAQIANAIYSYDENVFSYYYGIGVGEAPADADIICSELVKDILADFPDLQPDIFSKNSTQLQNIVDQWSENGPRLMLFIDNLDVIEDKDYSLDWLPRPTKNISIVLALRYPTRFANAFNRLGIETIAPSILSSGGIRNLIVRNLANVGKELSPDTLEAIQAWPLGKDLSILRSFLKLLIGFGDYEKLTEFIESMLENKTPKEFLGHMIGIAQQMHPEIPIKKLLGFICISRNGLSEWTLTNLANILSFQASEFLAEFNQFLSGSLKLDVTEPKLRRQILDNLSAEEILDLRRRLVNYIYNRNHTVAACLTAAHNPAQAQVIDLAYDGKISDENPDDFLEVLHQASEAGDDIALYGALSYLGTFEIMLERDPASLLAYWKKLLSQGRSLDVYRRLIATLCDNKEDSIRIYCKIARWILENLEDKSLAIPFYEKVISEYDMRPQLDKLNQRSEICRTVSTLTALQGDKITSKYYLALAGNLAPEECWPAYLLMARHREKDMAYLSAIDILRPIAAADPKRWGSQLGRVLLEYIRFLTEHRMARKRMALLKEAAACLGEAMEYDPTVLYSYSEAIMLMSTEFKDQGDHNAAITVLTDLLDSTPPESDLRGDVRLEIAELLYICRDYPRLKTMTDLIFQEHKYRVWPQFKHKFLAMAWQTTAAADLGDIEQIDIHLQDFTIYNRAPLNETAYFLKGCRVIISGLEKLFERLKETDPDKSAKIAGTLAGLYQAISGADNEKYYHIIKNAPTSK